MEDKRIKDKIKSNKSRKKQTSKLLVKAISIQNMGDHGYTKMLTPYDLSIICPLLSLRLPIRFKTLRETNVIKC